MRNHLRSGGNLLIWIVLSGATLVLIGWNNIAVPVAPSGDIAADMLLSNRIRDEGYLLVGHYSRWGFNHPGPYWSYYNQIFEIILSPSSLSRQQIWHIGAIAFNAGLLGFLARALSRFLLGRVDALFVVFTLSVFLIYCGSKISSIWMPNRIVIPFAAFLVCLLHIGDARHIYILPATFLACILIHGYVTMPLFTLPWLGLAVLVGCLHKGGWTSLKAATHVTVPSIAVAMLFFLPFPIDMIFVQESNVAKLLKANQEFKSMPRPSWSELSSFTLDLFFKPYPFFSLIYAFAAPLIPMAFKASEAVRARAVALYLLVGAVFVTAFFYYRDTPAPLFTFTAQFLACLPPLLLSAAAVAAFVRPLAPAELPAWRRFNYAGAGIVLAALVTFSFSLKPVPRPHDGQDLLAYADQIQAMKPDRMVAIAYAEHGQWPFIAGLLLELDRRHVPACTLAPHLGFLYTKKAVCGPDIPANVTIVPLAQCGDRCSFMSGEYGILAPPG